MKNSFNYSSLVGGNIGVSSFFSAWGEPKMAGKKKNWSRDCFTSGFIFGYFLIYKIIKNR